MTNAGQIDVRLGLDSDEFIKSFTKADDKLKELEKNLKKSTQDFENVSKAMAGTKNPSKELTGLFNELKNKLKEDQSALDSFQGRLKHFQGNLINTNPAVNMLIGSLKKLAGPAVIATVGKKLVDLGVQATNTAAKFETLAVSFEVLTGGKEAGQELSNALIELAAKTPLTSKALTDGAKTLLSFGESANEVVGDLKLLGDITGGDAQRMQSLTLAFAQVGSTGKLTGQDLLQMINAGFNPLETISKKTGKSVGQLKDEMSKGLITFRDVKQAMIDATSEGGRFYGMMNKQSETLEGRLATLDDTWQLVSKNMGDMFLPVAKKCVEMLIKLGDAALNATNKLKATQEQARLLKPSTDNATLSVEELNKKLKILSEYENNLLYSSDKRYAGARHQQDFKKRIADIEKEKNELIALYKARKQNESKKEGASSGGFLAISGGETTASSGSNRRSGSSTSKTTKDPKVEAAKKQKDELLAISKSYLQEMSNLESLNTAREDLNGSGGRFQTGYTEKLNILQWYYNERKRITEIANNDMLLAQEQFNQLEELKNQKLLEANLNLWSQYGDSLKSIVGNSFSSLLSGSQDFGNVLLNLMSSIYQQLIKIAINSAMKEIEIEQVKTTIILALRALTGGVGNIVSGVGGLIGKLPKFHSGGLSTQEQLAVIKKDERVLSPSESASYSNNEDGVGSNGVNNIMMFNIKAWDGKDVIQTLKSNSQTINQIVNSGIKNNQQGLRSTVQNL